MFFESIKLKKSSWHWNLQKFVFKDLAWESFPVNFSLPVES